MSRITLVLALVIPIVVLTSAVRVYEDDGESDTPADVAENLNSTGPAVYPDAKTTTTTTEEPPPEEKNKTSDGLNVIGLESGHRLEPSLSDKLSNDTQDNPENSELPINSSNIVVQESSARAFSKKDPAKVKEKSLLKQRESSSITKPFISSPKDIATRIIQREVSVEDESFQPMIGNPFQSSAQYNPQKFTQTPAVHHQHHHYQPTYPPPRAEDYSHQNAGRGVVFRDSTQDNGRQSHRPSHPFDQRGYHVPAQQPTLDYGSFQKNFFPSEQYPRDQHANLNSLHEYVQNDYKPPTPDNNQNQFVTWPEHSEHETPRHSPPPSWTTEEPEPPTYPPTRYYPTPTEYSPAKGFFSSALSMIAQSLKPSVPTHPFPFELTEQQPKNYYDSSSSKYQLLPPSVITSSDAPESIEYGKYEIITTPSTPEYHFPPTSPELHHHTPEVVHRKPSFYTQLPWHKIIKVLSAIVPFGLLASALTPNVVLINPNATSPKPIGNIYSYVTRQRSLEPDQHLFDQKIMDILNGIEEVSPQAVCIKHAICQAIDRNEAEDLTPEEHMAFKNKFCIKFESGIPEGC